LSKYQFTVKPNVHLISRMYQEHGYTVEEICLRLRYQKEDVEDLIGKFNLKYGEKSWRY